jgi:precorrin-6B methylase 2
MSSKPSNSPALGQSTSPNLLSPEKLPEVLYGFKLTQTLYVTAKLGLADHFHNGAKRCVELAAAVGANTQVLEHLMQLLLTLGVVAHDENDNYQLTPFGSLLRSDAPNSIQGKILSTAEIYAAWGDLWYSVQTGKAAFDYTFQMSWYEYLAQNAEANANFNRWMEETTRDWILPVLENYDLTKFTRFVDVGGSTGILTAAILTKYPHLQAIIFDQAHVVTDAEQVLKSAQVSDRCQIISGDFFESVPTQGDLYIISRVLLNWDDEHALKILKNCRIAMSDLAQLLIIDFVLPNQDATASALLSSLNLLVLGGRLLRTADEYDALLSQAGFQSPPLISTEGQISFIEAVPK